MPTLKTVLTATLLSSVALVPAATVVTFATTDAAYAKSDKSNGGSNGGRSAEARSGGGSSDKAQGKGKNKSGSNGKSASRGGPSAIEGFFDRLTGKDNAKTVRKVQPAKVERKAVSAAPKVAPAAPPRPAKGSGMHASELGKMNGALNANVNALIAHLKNGNANGPIGGMAMLAAAGYAADGMDDIVALKNEYIALDDALIAAGYVDMDGAPDLDAYLADVAGNGEIEAVQIALAGEGPVTLEDALVLEGFVDAEGNPDLDAYIDYRDGIAPIEAVNTPLTRIDGAERPTGPELDQAEELIAARGDAEGYMLSIWNKNPDSDPDIVTQAERDLLDKLYDRLAADADMLTEAIETYAPPPPAPVPTVEGDLPCDLENESCSPGDEEITLLAD